MGFVGRLSEDQSLQNSKNNLTKQAYKAVRQVLSNLSTKQIEIKVISGAAFCRSDLRIEIEERLQTRAQLFFDIFFAPLEHVHGYLGLPAICQLHRSLTNLHYVFRRQQSHAINQCQIRHKGILSLSQDSCRNRLWHERNPGFFRCFSFKIPACIKSRYLLC
jgi:hypothetical protein